MISYLFVSGFLGAGKTTLLNMMLDRYSHLKLGVIVNDFGSLAVDTPLIDPAQMMDGTAICELKSGQIFCSCLSGSFIDSVLDYQDISPDLVIVECSGLAKPSTLKDIVQVIEKKAPEQFNCLGMITVVDAMRHRVLEQSLMVIHEQIEASDLLLLSKTDLVPAGDAEELRKDLVSQYPDKPVLHFFPGSLDTDLLAMLKDRSGAYQAVDPQRHQGWGEKGRPTSFVLIPPRDMAAEELKTLLQPFQSRWYRLKGIIETKDKGACLADATDHELYISGTQKIPETPGLVCITHDHQLENDLRSALGLPLLTQEPSLTLLS